MIQSGEDRHEPELHFNSDDLLPKLRDSFGTLQSFDATLGQPQIFQLSALEEGLERLNNQLNRDVGIGAIYA